MRRRGHKENVGTQVKIGYSKAGDTEEGILGENWDTL